LVRFLSNTKFIAYALEIGDLFFITHSRQTVLYFLGCSMLHFDAIEFFIPHHPAPPLEYA